MTEAPIIKPKLECRFYKERFPEMNEAVNTNVSSIGDMGAYVKLLEYNNVDGKTDALKLAFIFISRTNSNETRKVQL